MSSSDPVNHDLACYNCGYNLRTLLPTTRCPECGRPVQQTISIAALVDPNSGYSFKGLANCTALAHDLPCEKCKANLRNSAPTDRCPTCGYPILRSIAAEEIKVRRSYQREAATDLRLHIVAGASGYSIHAIRFAYDALARLRGGKQSARSICLAVRDFALSYCHNDPQEASQALIDWNLPDSDHIGLVIAALIEIGLLRATSSDSPQAFKNLFNHQQLMTTRT